MLDSILWWSACLGGGLVFLATAALTLVALYLVRIRHKYSHIPSPKMDSFFFGHAANIVTMRRQTMNEYEPLETICAKWAAELGCLYIVFLGHVPMVMTTNPEDVKRVTYDESIDKAHNFTENVGTIFGQRFMGHGLLTIPDYETWKPRRKLYDPCFKRSSLKEFVLKFNECVDILLEKLRPQADGKTEVAMKEAFHETALNMISKIAFSSDFNEWGGKTNIGLGQLASMSMKALAKAFTSPFPLLFSLMHPYEAKMDREAIAAMRRIGRECIEKRIKAVTSGEEVPNDILTQILQISVGDKSVDMEMLIDDFVTFYVAGQETTANTLLFTIILIHQHPEILDKLLSEVESVLGGRKEVTGDDLDKLKYTEQVIQETLRKYPTVIGFFKDSPKGGIKMSDYHIPEGTQMLFLTAVMCKNPKYFSDPNTFDPSRFDADKPRPGPFVYLPFGAGHRICIGRHFAMIESKIILARLLQSFKVTLPPSYKLVAEEHTTLRPKGNVPCFLEEIIHVL